VLGHIDLLGDPLSLAQSYGKGMSGFVRGMAHGHVKTAAKELVQGVVGGKRDLPYVTRQCIFCLFVYK
jgi:hypothetical protein